MVQMTHDNDCPHRLGHDCLCGLAELQHPVRTPPDRMTTYTVERYGRMKVSKIRATYNALRDAVRAHDSEAAEAAFDRYEQWADYVFDGRHDDTALTEARAEIERLRAEVRDWEISNAEQIGALTPNEAQALRDKERAALQEGKG